MEWTMEFTAIYPTLLCSYLFTNLTMETRARVRCSVRMYMHVVSYILSMWLLKRIYVA